jgi:hypothetical protein
MPKACPSDKIINPATGRCVLRTGPIGKKLLALSKKVPTPTPTTCPPDKIVNPKTGKCVLRTGAIGKNLLAAQTPSKPKAKPKAKKSPTRPSPAPSATKPKAKPKAKKSATSPSPGDALEDLLDQLPKGRSKVKAPTLPRGQVGVRTEQWDTQRKPTRKADRQTVYDQCGEKCFLIPEEKKYPVCAGKSGNPSCDFDCDGVRAARNNAFIVLNRKNLQNEKQSQGWATRAIPAAELIGVNHCGWSVN